MAASDNRMSPGWLLFLGIVQIVTGVLAIALPHIGGLAIATMLGIVLCVAGGFQIVGAFRGGSFGSGLGGFLGGALYAVVGILVLTRPGIALGVITLLAGLLLLFRGFLRIGISFDLKPEKGWGWVLFGGAVAILLGIMVLAGWPESAWWFVGTVLGIELLFSGWAHVFLGMAAKDVQGAA